MDPSSASDATPPSDAPPPDAVPSADAPSEPTAPDPTEPVYEPVAVDLRDYVDFNLDAASGRRVVTTEVVAVDIVCLEPDQVIEARTLAGADVIYTVIGGRAWVVTDDAEVTLDPLQAVVVPAGIPHGVRNLSPDPLILQVVVSPPDEMPNSVLGPAPDADEHRPPPRLGLVERLRRTLSGE